MAITAKSLHKGFHGVPVLSGVTLTLRDGEFFVVLGSPKSGKSTLIRCLAGMIAPDSGSVEISDSARNMVGVVLQDSKLDPLLTVRENLAMHAALRRLPKATWEETMAELTGRLDLGEVMRTRLGDLPAGIARRVDIALALLHQPQVLLLDEPVRGLDPDSTTLIWAALAEQYNRHVTIVITTDQPMIADQAERVAVMVDGRIIAVNDPASLIETACTPVLTLRLADAERSRTELEAVGMTMPAPDGDGQIVWPVTSADQARDVVSVLGEQVRDFDYRHGTMEDVLRIAVQAGDHGEAPFGSGEVSATEMADAVGADFQHDFRRVIASEPEDEVGLDLFTPGALRPRDGVVGPRLIGLRDDAAVDGEGDSETGVVEAARGTGAEDVGAEMMGVDGEGAPEIERAGVEDMGAEMGEQGGTVEHEDTKPVEHENTRGGEHKGVKPVEHEDGETVEQAEIGLDDLVDLSSFGLPDLGIDVPGHADALKQADVAALHHADRRMIDPTNADGIEHVDAAPAAAPETAMGQRRRAAAIRRAVHRGDKGLIPSAGEGLEHTRRHVGAEVADDTDVAPLHDADRGVIDPAQSDAVEHGGEKESTEVVDAAMVDVVEHVSTAPAAAPETDSVATTGPDVPEHEDIATVVRRRAAAIRQGIRRGDKGHNVSADEDVEPTERRVLAGKERAAGKTGTRTETGVPGVMGSASEPLTGPVIPAASEVAAVFPDETLTEPVTRVVDGKGDPSLDDLLAGLLVPAVVGTSVPLSEVPPADGTGSDVEVGVAHEAGVSTEGTEDDVHVAAPVAPAPDHWSRASHFSATGRTSHGHRNPRVSTLTNPRVEARTDSETTRPVTPAKMGTDPITATPRSLAAPLASPAVSDPATPEVGEPVIPEATDLVVPTLTGEKTPASESRPTIEPPVSPGAQQQGEIANAIWGRLTSRRRGIPTLSSATPEPPPPSPELVTAPKPTSDSRDLAQRTSDSPDPAQRASNSGDPHPGDSDSRDSDPHASSPHEIRPHGPDSDVLHDSLIPESLTPAPKVTPVTPPAEPTAPAPEPALTPEPPAPTLEPVPAPEPPAPPAPPEPTPPTAPPPAEPTPPPEPASVLLPPLFTEDVELDQLAAVSHLLKGAIPANPLPSFDEQFPPGRLPLEESPSATDPAEQSEQEPSTQEGLWDAELARPVDETLAKQARVRLAVEKRMSEARRRRAKDKED